LIYSFWVHFVTNTSLYFWSLCKILRLLIPINPILWKNNFDPYVLHGPKSVHLWGSGQGTKHVFKHILLTFTTKWTIPSLTVVLIPISTHPNVFCVRKSIISRRIRSRIQKGFSPWIRGPGGNVRWKKPRVENLVTVHKNKIALAKIENSHDIHQLLVL
jgi:hypothetical protein